MSNFGPINRDTDSCRCHRWMNGSPERHLARFVAEVVDQLDLSAMEKT